MNRWVTMQRERIPAERTPIDKFVGQSSRWGSADYVVAESARRKLLENYCADSGICNQRTRNENYVTRNSRNSRQELWISLHVICPKIGKNLGRRRHLAKSDIQSSTTSLACDVSCFFVCQRECPALLRCERFTSVGVLSGAWDLKLHSKGVAYWSCFAEISAKEHLFTTTRNSNPQPVSPASDFESCKILPLTFSQLLVGRFSREILSRIDSCSFGVKHILVTV
jgi:hypothetical protein